MSTSYVFKDQDGDCLEIRSSPLRDDPAALVRTFENSVRIPANNLPDVVAAIYAAAGQPAPIVLPRLTQLDSHLDFTDLTRTPRNQQSGYDLYLDIALELAAYIATYAEYRQAQANPGKGRVSDIPSEKRSAKPSTNRQDPR